MRPCDNITPTQRYRERREKGRREEEMGGELGRRLGEAWEERWGDRNGKKRKRRRQLGVRGRSLRSVVSLVVSGLCLGFEESRKGVFTSLIGQGQ